MDLARDDFRFPEGKYPREAFVDVGFVPPLDKLSLRIGRQQVVWGEADLFRSIDVVNPLRLDQQGLVGDDLDQYREPLWIAKALYDLGSFDALKLIDMNLEFFYSPNWRPLTDRIIVGESFRIKLDSDCIDAGGDFNCRRPNQQPFDRIRHPWEVTRVGPYRTEALDHADLGGQPGCEDVSNLPGVNLPAGCGDFIYLIDNPVPTSLFDKDASMFGVRLLGKTFGNLDFTLNYLFKRTEVPGTVLPAHLLFDRNNPQNGDATTDQNNARTDKLLEAATTDSTVLKHRCLDGNPRNFDQSNVFILEGTRGYPDHAFTGCLTVPFWYPWTHIFGFTLTYNDFDYTGMIFRLEQSYSTKEPRNGVPPLAGVRRGDFPGTRDFDTSGKRSTQVWRSMVGFDYLRAFPQYAPSFVKPYKYLRTWFYDQWFMTFQFLNEYYSHADGQIGLLDSVTDRMHHFNPLLTYVMTGFFLNNVFRPWIAVGYDVNDRFPLLWLQGTYFLTPRLALRIGEILYLGSRHAESFVFLHKYADRDTLFFRLTYFLL
jgi:hypothetical protein